MAAINPTVLRFVLQVSGKVLDVLERYHPRGQIVLNRTAWRGKAPRSCAVTKFQGRPDMAGSPGPVTFDVEVSCRPKGCITYLGNTKYDGWTAMLLDQSKDGTLLDGHGKPLSEGQAPVYLPYELYGDIDFNEIDFGEFIGEFEVEGVRHAQYEDVIRELNASWKCVASIYTTFMAPRRQRPNVKIVLSNAPSGIGGDRFGTRIIHVNNSTPHLQQVLLDHLTELTSGFIEGRYSMNCLSNDDFVFVKLSDALVDCTPNEQGKDSRFNCLTEYVPTEAFDELAQRLMSTYEVDVTVVDGIHAGLILRKPVAK